MVERYLIDTNAFIDYLAGSMPPNGLGVIDSILDLGDFIVSVITQIEVLRFQVPDEYLEKCLGLMY